MDLLDNDRRIGRRLVGGELAANTGKTGILCLHLAVDSGLLRVPESSKSSHSKREKRTKTMGGC